MSGLPPAPHNRELDVSRQGTLRVVILSGASWWCTGGGQRPAEIARVFGRRGYDVTYWSSYPRNGAGQDAGVHIAAWNAWDEAAFALTAGPPGLVICALPLYYPQAQQLADAGWTVLYDLLDDWDGFVAGSDLDPHALRQEKALIDLACVVTVSAEELYSRARRLGAGRVVLVPNGGPSEPIRLTQRPPDMAEGEVAAVYAGALYGSWFDWSAINALSADGRIGTTLIGAAENLPDLPRVRGVGEKTLADCDQHIVAGDAGIIPFRHDLCHSVDPIKYYRYGAAGKWTVTTPCVWPLLSRPYVVIAEPQDFPAAIIEAQERGKREPIPPGFVAANSWEVRTDAMLQAVRTAQQTRTVAPPTVAQPPTVVTEKMCRLRATWEAPATCNMEPPCPYCSNAHSRANYPSALSASPEEWTAAWLRLAEQYGPLYLSICFGEPLSDEGAIQVAAAVARRNRVDIVTNLVAEPPSLLAHNPNIALATSFHPDHWSVKQFIRRRAEYARAGFRCGVSQIVAYPEFLPYLDEWRAALLHVNAQPQVIPFWGEGEDKQQYPAAYTPEEWALVGEASRANSLGGPAGRKCAAGVRYLFVRWDGTVTRCVMTTEKIGDLLAGSVQVSAESWPCAEPICSCPDLWQFLEA